ncbi:MAG: RNA-binding S4 domain-containing protein [Gallionella sp.]|nr:RNA-binding S4 domain-containing protein [Gallionella sp.]
MMPDPDKIRIDKWLWVARFFKTRALAADAVESGKVLVGEVRVKPAKAIAAGDVLDIRIGQFRHEVTVLALSEKRGPASAAQQLYRESESGRAQRAALAAQLKAMPLPAFKGRPTKRDRREIEKLQRDE